MQFDAAVLERITQRFWRDMWQSVVPEAIDEAGIEVEQFGPVQATAFHDLPEADLLNQIRGAAEPAAVGGGHLAAAVEWMRAREVDFQISVAEVRPGAAEAKTWLRQRGFEPAGGWVKYVRDTSPPPPGISGVVVYELGDDEGEGEGLSAIAAESLNLPVTAGTLFFSLPQEPPWRCYTAALGPDEPAVATGVMLVEDGVAQFGPGTTLPRARGRGCNTALLRRRLIDAAAAGCHTVFVELNHSSSGGDAARAHRIYLKAGFEVAYESPIWRRPVLHPASAA